MRIDHLLDLAGLLQQPNGLPVGVDGLGLPRRHLSIRHRLRKVLDGRSVREVVRQLGGVVSQAVGICLFNGLAHSRV